MATQNVYEQLAREHKVSKLVDAMHANGWSDPRIVNAMGPQHWAAVERVAGIKPCSEITRQMAVDRIRRANQRPRPASIAHPAQG